MRRRGWLNKAALGDTKLGQIELRRVEASQEPIAAACGDIDLMQTPRSSADLGAVAAAKMFEVKSDKF